MPKHRKKTRVVDYWRSPCVRPALAGSGAANRPAQVFDVEIWNKLRQEARQSEGIAAQAQDLTVIAIWACRQDIVNEGFSHGEPFRCHPVM